MRLQVLLVPQTQDVLPWHYEEWLQGLIYRALPERLARFWHEHGFVDGSRTLKLFVFSRLHGPYQRAEGNQGLRFTGPVRWWVASPSEEFLAGVMWGLMRQGEVHIGPVRFAIETVEAQDLPPYRRPVRLKALSPITVRSTLVTPEGRKKTYYYVPQEREFGERILTNLRRKIRAWTGEDIPPTDAQLRPVRVSKRNLVIARYKGTIIKGWTGIYELDAPEPYFRMALEAGLGEKNSQGFGFVDVWEPRPRATPDRTSNAVHTPA